MSKLLGKLGWRGQCSCCNGPKDKKAIRHEEDRFWRREMEEEVNDQDMGRIITDQINADPEEVARLLKSMEQARQGKRTPLRKLIEEDARQNIG